MESLVGNIVELERFKLESSIWIGKIGVGKLGFSVGKYNWSWKVTDEVGKFKRYDHEICEIN